MPRYRVTNRKTRETEEVEAPYAQTACDLLGWPIEGCDVELLREGPYSGWAMRRLHLGIEDEDRLSRLRGLGRRQ